MTDTQRQLAIEILRLAVKAYSIDEDAGIVLQTLGGAIFAGLQGELSAIAYTFTVDALAKIDPTGELAAKEAQP